MKVFYTDRFTYPLPPGHRFPAQKYHLVRIEIESLGISNLELLEPDTVEIDNLLLAHTEAYVHKILQGMLSEREIRRIGLPWSVELVNRSLRSVGGTIQACREALTNGIGIYLGGGTHHAGIAHGEGFCLFNDAAVAARLMQREGLVKRVLIVDCDVHQGNGTAEILTGDSTIFTFSIHGLKNFPLRKIDGDMDIPLPDGTGDEEYLLCLREGLLRAFFFSDPDLVIYLAGADPHKGDRLGRLSLTFDGLARRDWFVLDQCVQRKIPIAITLSGGYGKVIMDTVQIHTQTVEIAANWYQQQKVISVEDSI